MSGHDRPGEPLWYWSDGKLHSTPPPDLKRPGTITRLRRWRRRHRIISTILIAYIVLMLTLWTVRIVANIITRARFG